MIIKFVTFHTIPCPFTACCSDVNTLIDEGEDNDNAVEIARNANKSLLMRFGQFHTIECFNEMNDDLQAARDQEVAANYSMCSRYDRGETVDCCDNFDYRHFIGDVWSEFWERITSVWDRFLGFRTLGCCAELDDEADGPRAVMEAQQAFTRFTNIHKKRAFAKMKDYHTIGCCTHIEEDPVAANAHERWVNEKSPCARFARFETIKGCVPMTQQEQELDGLEAIKREKIEGLTVCEALVEGHTVNTCELCFHVRRQNFDADDVVSGDSYNMSL